MCIAGLGQSQTPSPPPAAPTPLSVEERTAKTADTVGKPTKRKSNKKETFRRVKSGGRSTSAAAKALNLTPTSSS